MKSLHMYNKANKAFYLKITLYRGRCRYVYIKVKKPRSFHTHFVCPYLLTSCRLHYLIFLTSFLGKCYFTRVPVNVAALAKEQSVISTLLV